jgi:hypothetical protein
MIRVTSELEFLNNLLGARIRVGVLLSYRAARLHRLAELIPRNRFLGSLEVKKFGLRSVEVNKKGIYFAFRDEGACISLLAIKVSLLYFRHAPNNYKDTKP